MLSHIVKPGLSGTSSSVDNPFLHIHGQFSGAQSIYIDALLTLFNTPRTPLAKGAPGTGAEPTPEPALALQPRLVVRVRVRVPLAVPPPLPPSPVAASPPALAPDLPECPTPPAMRQRISNFERHLSLENPLPRKHAHPWAVTEASFTDSASASVTPVVDSIECALSTSAGAEPRTVANAPQ